MTEFKIGDIVRMTKGKRGEPGFVEQVKRVGTYTHHLRYESVVALTELPTFIRTYDWTVELISRPAPPLPTKPGTIGWATWKGERCVVRRNSFGCWDVYGDADREYGSDDKDLSDFTEAVLIPKELADRVVEWGRLDGDTTGFELLVEVAERLKEQNDE